MEYDKETNKWTVDKHIPIAVLIAVILQSFAWVYWGASFVAATTARLDGHEVQLRGLQNLPERIASLETQSRINNDILREIRDELRISNYNHNNGAEDANGERTRKGW